jgi:nucleotide-binding universal stress UspA family protein
MPQITHILCPLDFSDTSEIALRYSIQLAQRFGARVTALHVYQLMSLIYPEDVLVDPMGTDAQLRKATEERLTKTIAQLDADGVPIATALREGLPYVEILDAVATLGADLIVMGTHGRSGIRRALVGSVTERVVRSATVPVLSVRKPEA